MNPLVTNEQAPTQIALKLSFSEVKHVTVGEGQLYLLISE